MFELISLMSRILDRVSGNHAPNNLSPSSNKSNWTDPKDTRREARKAFSSQFAKKLVSGKFGDNWDRHQESFLRSCEEWEIEGSEYVDYLRETLSSDALNYVEGKVENDPGFPWTTVSKSMPDRYNNVNRQKEVSDSLY